MVGAQLVIVGAQLVMVGAQLVMVGAISTEEAGLRCTSPTYVSPEREQRSTIYAITEFNVNKKYLLKNTNNNMHLLTPT